MSVQHTLNTASTTQTATVRAVIVETDGTARVEDLTPSDSGSLLLPLQEAVGGLIDVVALDDGIDMYVHDEGFYTCEPNPVATMVAMAAGRRTQPFFGPAVFTGGANSAGDDTSIAPEGAEAIQSLAAWLTGQPDLMKAMTAHALNAVGR